MKQYMQNGLIPGILAIIFVIILICYKAFGGVTGEANLVVMQWAAILSLMLCGISGAIAFMIMVTEGSPITQDDHVLILSIMGTVLLITASLIFLSATIHMSFFVLMTDVVRIITCLGTAALIVVSIVQKGMSKGLKLGFIIFALFIGAFLWKMATIELDPSKHTVKKSKSSSSKVVFIETCKEKGGKASSREKNAKKQDSGSSALATRKKADLPEWLDAVNQAPSSKKKGGVNR